VYPIDERDTVTELADLPKSCAGGPIPLVLADEAILLLSYFMPSGVMGEHHQKISVAVVQFHHSLMHLLGPPNDEAIQGHPLWRRGLDSYGAYQVRDSSLLRRVAAMNYVHPRNNLEAFDRFHHYIITFHDSTFECLAESYTFSVHEMPTEGDRYAHMANVLRARDERRRSEMPTQRKAPVGVRLRRWLGAHNSWTG
jgi:hypothetical protein